MKIVFAGTTIADTTLEGHQGLRLGADFDAQVQKFMRAANPSFADRGNATHSLSWSVSISHGSYRLAEKHFLTHAQTVNGKGDCVFTIGKTGDTEDLNLNGAILKASPRSVKGVETIFDYTLQGGAIT